MKSKILLTIIFLVFITVTGYSQVYKNRAKQLAYKSKDNYGRWTKWSDWEDCNILIVTNLDNSKFTIYSKVTQEFDIIKFYPKEYDDEGVEVFRILVVDKDGLRCNIRQRFIKSEYFSSQMYIDYADFIYVYNLTSN